VRKRHSSTKKRTITLVLDKRQKFVVSVTILSLGFLFSEFQVHRIGLLPSIVLAIFSDLLFFWTVREDLPKGLHLSLSVFILPFFYTLAFGLFYFLVPPRLVFRLLLTLLYAVGLYSLYLSQNIFIVGTERTIQLLSGARIVSFVLTLLSFFFLANTSFTLHLQVYFLLPLIFIFTFLLIFQSLYTYGMQAQVSFLTLLKWSLILTLVLCEAVVILWFWPSNPTIIALFLTGCFYTIVGLSHVWLDRRLFRSVLWEYVWVSAIVFFVLIAATSWGR
jgi:hypothetical protein